MLSVTFQDITLRSKIVRGIYDGDPDTADLDFVCVLYNHGDGVCEVMAAHGKLTVRAIARIGLKAIQDGYKVMRVTRAKKGRALRWFKKVKDDGVHVVYEADLHPGVEDELKALV